MRDQQFSEDRGFTNTWNSELRQLLHVAHSSFNVFATLNKNHLWFRTAIGMSSDADICSNKNCDSKHFFNMQHSILIFLIENRLLEDNDFVLVRHEPTTIFESLDGGIPKVCLYIYNKTHTHFIL